MNHICQWICILSVYLFFSFFITITANATLNQECEIDIYNISNEIFEQTKKEFENFQKSVEFANNNINNICKTLKDFKDEIERWPLSVRKGDNQQIKKAETIIKYLRKLDKKIPGFLPKEISRIINSKTYTGLNIKQIYQTRTAIYNLNKFFKEKQLYLKLAKLKRKINNLKISVNRVNNFLDLMDTLKPVNSNDIFEGLNSIKSLLNIAEGIAGDLPLIGNIIDSYSKSIDIFLNSLKQLDKKIANIRQGSLGGQIGKCKAAQRCFEQQNSPEHITTFLLDITALPKDILVWSNPPYYFLFNRKENECLLINYTLFSPIIAAYKNSNGRININHLWLRLKILNNTPSILNKHREIAQKIFKKFPENPKYVSYNINYAPERACIIKKYDNYRLLYRLHNASMTKWDTCLLNLPYTWNDYDTFLGYYLLDTEFHKKILNYYKLLSDYTILLVKINNNNNKINNQLITKIKVNKKNGLILNDNYIEFILKNKKKKFSISIDDSNYKVIASKVIEIGANTKLVDVKLHQSSQTKQSPKRYIKVIDLYSLWPTDITVHYWKRQEGVELWKGEQIELKVHVCNENYIVASDRSFSIKEDWQELQRIFNAEYRTCIFSLSEKNDILRDQSLKYNSLVPSKQPYLELTCKSKKYNGQPNQTVNIKFSKNFNRIEKIAFGSKEFTDLYLEERHIYDGQCNLKYKKKISQFSEVSARISFDNKKLCPDPPRVKIIVSPPSNFKIAQKITLSAKYSGLKDHVNFSWSGAVNGSDKKVFFTPMTPGTYKITLKVSDLDNHVATDSIIIKVGTNLKIVPLSSKKKIHVGEPLFLKVLTASNLTIKNNNFLFLWETDKSGIFTNNTNQKTIVRFNEPGTHKIKVYLYQLKDNFKHLIQESETYSIEVILPSEKVKKIVNQAEQHWKKGYLTKSANMLQQALALDPNNIKIKENLQQKQAIIKQINTQINEVKHILNNNNIEQAENIINSLPKFIKNYKPYQEITAKLKQCKLIKNEADDLFKKAKYHEEQGNIFEALKYYNKSLELWYNSEVQSHIEQIRSNIATARKLRKEGQKLLASNKYEEALSKFVESLNYYQDPQLKKYINDLQLKLKQNKNYNSNSTSLGTTSNNFSVLFNNPQTDGIPIDWCLTLRNNCGKPAADYFCKQKGYDGAISFEEAPNIGYTKFIKTGQICKANFCNGFRFIKCSGKKSNNTTVDNKNSKYGSYVFEKANYWFYGYKGFENFYDMQKCAELCDKDPKCKVASFHGPNAPAQYRNLCILRDKVGPRHTEQPDIYSWVKPASRNNGDSHENSVIRRGTQSRYGSYVFEKANYWFYGIKVYEDFHDPQKCAELCDLNPKCKVATFHGPNGPGKYKNMCILRDKIGPRHTEQPDTISWVKH